MLVHLPATPALAAPLLLLVAAGLVVTRLIPRLRSGTGWARLVRAVSVVDVLAAVAVRAIVAGSPDDLGWVALVLVVVGGAVRQRVRGGLLAATACAVAHVASGAAAGEHLGDLATGAAALLLIGGFAGAMAREMDLERQRATRRLERLEALRTRFVATVAHDLRSPLTTVKGVASILRDRRDQVAPRQVDAMLEQVERQAGRLNRLADDLLDAARLDASRLRLDLGPVDLAAVVGRIVEEVEEDDDVRLDAPEPLVVVGDGPRLERVVWNLLGNALKHGRPPVEVAVVADGASAHLVVRDHGRGLDDAQRAQLFTDFSDGGDPRSVGLGLAIVWELVAAHGGSVAYEDAAPGARFTVRLPQAGPAEGSAPARQRVSRLGAAEGVN